jgi:ABC-2 type transport system permease protein
MQYRASFIMMAAGHFLVTGIEIAGVWVLFSRFSNLNGWTLPEVALLYGMVHCAFALAESIGRGFDILPSLVRAGSFDYIMLRPRNTAFQVAALELQLMRIGRFSQGLLVLIWAIHTLNISLSPAHVFLVIFAITGGACLFYGLFVIQATISFWTVETLELMNTVTYGGIEAAQFPLSIYQPWFKSFFTFIIPLACISYFPAQALLGKSDSGTLSKAWLYWSAPGIGVLFLILALTIWNAGINHYHSTGS